ncbi:MAG: transposase [Polaribacter sp.]|jgi:transposase
MSKWVTKAMEELLGDINEVPYTDNREGQQLSILMKGFVMINNQAMGNAAIKIRASIRKWDLESASESSNQSGKTVYDDEEVDELTRLRPIR